MLQYAQKHIKRSIDEENEDDGSKQRDNGVDQQDTEKTAEENQKRNQENQYPIFFVANQERRRT
ncbi:hypothetical protein ccbrp13_61590 [Ktedonobacteria bacterium brp13]|nr:hypothetical protein ccbrp13_61590 [Ktedonobacteria bacterium brp13]